MMLPRLLMRWKGVWGAARISEGGDGLGCGGGGGVFRARVVVGLAGFFGSAFRCRGIGRSCLPSTRWR